MSIKALEIISKDMAELGIPYSFGTWTSEELPSPFFIGEYQESESLNEDGQQEIIFSLTGYSRNSWLELEEAKEKIERYYSRVSGRLETVEGMAVAFFYTNSLIVPTGDAELKKIQINLKIFEWKV